MDAQGAANIIELLQYLEDKAGIRIRHSFVHLLETPIIERSAFRDMFGCGGTLYSMDARRVSNLDKARENARALALEVLQQIPAVRHAGIPGLRNVA